MQVLAIITPNHLHAPMAIAALDAGFHVLSEKPMTRDLAEAQAILLPPSLKPLEIRLPRLGRAWSA